MIANSTYNNCREYYTNSNYKTNHTNISTNSFTQITITKAFSEDGKEAFEGICKSQFQNKRLGDLDSGYII